MTTVSRAVRPAADRATRGTQAIALGSLMAGVIHVGVCPEHFREATLFGVFFLVLATVQLGWAAAVVSRPSVRVLVTGASIQIATVGLWLVPIFISIGAIGSMALWGVALSSGRLRALR